MYQDKIKCIGIYIEHNKTECNKTKQKTNLINKSMIFGKNQTHVISSPVVSKLLYVATILKYPNQAINNNETEIYFHSTVKRELDMFKKER